MESIILRILFQNWQRKVISLIVAIVVWVFVNQSITEIKTISNVPVRVVNLPSDKTIVGLLPNGYISHRITLTLGGSRDVIRDLERGDLEILLDASTAESDDWVIQITKKNLVSLNPALDLRYHINFITHPEFILKRSQLISEKVPISIKQPIGFSPEGYEFLDIWPEHLVQDLSGPKEEIQKIKLKGLKLTLDLNQITKDELDMLTYSKKPGHDDEVSFQVPEKWKKVSIPFRRNELMSINDPEAKHLHIDFLRNRLLPIGNEIPIVIYYPMKHSKVINPNTHALAETEEVIVKSGITLLTIPLYVRNVSRLFLNVVRENIEIVVIAAPKDEREVLQWNVEVIDPRELEDTYVAFVLAELKEQREDKSDFRKRESILRKRFNEYMRKLSLYTADGEKLKLTSTLKGDKIIVETNN